MTHWTLDINDLIASWYYDGFPAACSFFKKKLPNAKGHICLYHSRKRCGEQFTGGWAKLIKQCLDMMAFFPNPLLSVSANVLIAQLQSITDEQKGLEYLVSGVGIGGFYTTDGGEWRAVWSSSFRHVVPGYACYLNNDVESNWKSETLNKGS